MADARRVKRVAQQLRREIGEMLAQDKVLQESMLPEKALGVDGSVSAVATVTDVELSNDLQVAKVYVSVYGDESGVEYAMAGLKDKAKYVRAGVARRMRLRMAPDIRFIADDSYERGSEVLAILESLADERSRREKGELEPPIDWEPDEEDQKWLERGARLEAEERELGSSSSEGTDVDKDWR